MSKEKICVDFVLKRNKKKKSSPSKVACLELLFLILYSKESFDPGRFLRLLTVFEEQAFGVHQLNRSHLNAETREGVSTIGLLSVLVLLTSLNLESVLQDERCKEFLEEVFSKHMSVMHQINERLAHWGRIRHHGPVLLAWSILHCRLEQMAALDPKLASVAGNYSVAYQMVAASAFNIHVMKFLSSCANTLSRGSEHNLVGYLSVLKQLLSATLTAFDVAVIPGTDDFVAFACSLFSNQPALCAQFWAWDATHPARGSLLQLVQSRYPFDSNLCLKLLRSLACETSAAVHVLNAVHSLSTFTQALPASLACGVAECKSPARVELVANHDSWLCCDQHLGALMVKGKKSQNRSVKYSRFCRMLLVQVPVTHKLSKIEFKWQQIVSLHPRTIRIKFVQIAQFSFPRITFG